MLQIISIIMVSSPVRLTRIPASPVSSVASPRRPCLKKTEKSYMTEK